MSNSKMLDLLAKEDVGTSPSKRAIKVFHHFSRKYLTQVEECLSYVIKNLSEFFCHFSIAVFIDFCSAPVVTYFAFEFIF